MVRATADTTERRGPLGTTSATSWSASVASVTDTRCTAHVRRPSGHTSVHDKELLNLFVVVRSGQITPRTVAVLDVHRRSTFRMALVFGAGCRGTSGFLFRCFLIIGSRLPSVAAGAANATRLTTVTVMVMVMTVTRTAGSFTAQAGSASAQAVTFPGRTRSRVAATAAARCVMVMLR